MKQTFKCFTTAFSHKTSIPEAYDLNGGQVKDPVKGISGWDTAGPNLTGWRREGSKSV